MRTILLDFMYQFWMKISTFKHFSIFNLMGFSHTSYTSLSHMDSYPLFMHHNDVIMSDLASQITRLTIVYSSVYSRRRSKKHQSPASLASVRWIRSWPVNSPHKGRVTRKIFPFDDVIMDKVIKQWNFNTPCYQDIQRLRMMSLDFMFQFRMKMFNLEPYETFLYSYRNIHFKVWRMTWVWWIVRLADLLLFRHQSLLGSVAVISDSTHIARAGRSWNWKSLYI